MSAPCCASPRPDCMGMLVEGIGDRCQALQGIVSEGTASAQRINRTVPVKRAACMYTACNYPEGECSGGCLGGRM